MLVGLLVAVVSGGVLAALSRSGSAPHPVDTPSPVLAPSPPVLPAAILAAPPERLDASSVPVAPPPATPDVRSRAPIAPVVEAEASTHDEAPPAASSPPQSHLADEVALLQQARSELRAGQPGRALGTLDAHQKQFPHGLLGIEAEVLRIEALSRSGHANVAAARARRFIASHPNTPYGPRLQALTGDAPPRDEGANP